MKIAYVHVLPLEYYPPARNTLVLLSRVDSWSVRAWTSANTRNLPEWSDPSVDVRRASHPGSRVPLPLRIGGYLAWHTRVASELAAWRPDAVIAVEPHSALAVWIYHTIFRGGASLFIHHHEYYAQDDFKATGMRVLRATRSLERRDLFPRAVWVSQTNEERLRMLESWNPGIRPGAGRVLPNYPPATWIETARAQMRAESPVIRIVYLGAASFEDTFIREIATWVAERPDLASLHVCGDNVAPEVWRWLDTLNAANVTSNMYGIPYDRLPAFLPSFDVGLILYKGNTLNFVHNVPNKAIEYLAAGLEVWYPPEMTAMREFHSRFPDQPLREIDFKALPDTIGVAAPPARHKSDPFPFTCESALAPLIAELKAISRSR